MASPTQPQVIDEVWDDERIRSFLALEPYGDQSRDFYLLTRAYQGMRAEDFRRFLSHFLEAGGDLQATDRQGRTISEIVSRHRHGAEFLAALQGQAAQQQ